MLCNYQDANISVIIRYPIKEIELFEKIEFLNVVVKLAISKTQDIWAMSNWYGKEQFSDVIDFYKSRFNNSTEVIST